MTRNQPAKIPMQMEYIGNIGGKPVYARPEDAEHVRAELRSLSSRIQDELEGCRKDVARICAEVADKSGAKRVGDIIREANDL